jgi:hypothetical protein
MSEFSGNLCPQNFIKVHLLSIPDLQQYIPELQQYIPELQQ